MRALVLLAALALATPAAAMPVGYADPSGPAAAPAPPAKGVADPHARAIARADSFGVDRICDLIEASAKVHALDPHFFARLIWKESRFDIAAISPVGAQGIAQFMPGTAKLEGLADPFDPDQAIPASARHLARLRRAFGNLGLAAAAYNAGPERVSRWLKGRSGLPYETIDYVESITYRPAEWFRQRGRTVERRPLDEKLSFADACRRLPVMKTRAVFAAASRKPWGVQIAGGINRNAAARAFDRVVRRHPNLLRGESPILVKGRRGKGVRYSARVGTDSRAEAAALCNRLRRVGAACTIARN